MELRQLRYFVHVSRMGSFRGAATSLGVAQPALSRQIKALEDELGSSLLLRTRQGVRLSEAGRVFRENVERLLGDLDTAVRDFNTARSGQDGSLRVAFSEVASIDGLLPNSVREFRSHAPAINVSLLPMNSLVQMAALRDKKIDIGLVYGNPKILPDFNYRKVSKEFIVIALRDDHRLAGQPTIKISDLCNEQLISTIREINPPYHDAILEACQSGGLTPHLIKEATSNAAVLTMVAMGLGIGFVASSMRSRTPARVILRSVQNMSVLFDLTLVWRRDNDNPSTERFVSTIMELASSEPALLMN
jgi:DNA-binding transcriptional LysR family regulator